MPSLKDYRDRIDSVKSTKKITSAMKMVAASKLKKAQEQAEANQPYTKAMAKMLARVSASMSDSTSGPRLLTGTGKDNVHLLIVMTANRGLCGGFNGNIARQAHKEIEKLLADGKEVKIICIGRKGFDALKGAYKNRIIQTFSEYGGKEGTRFSDVKEMTRLVLEEFEKETFDVCTLLYNEFNSVLSQKPVAQQLIPFKMPEALDGEEDEEEKLLSPYEFEPEEEKILAELLPRNLGVQLFGALLDSAAGEQAARMTAMDSATRNAGDMIDNLTLQYNRARQAYITKELIEIISGAEAL